MKTILQIETAQDSIYRLMRSENIRQRSAPADVLNPYVRFDEVRWYGAYFPNEAPRKASKVRIIQLTISVEPIRLGKQ